MLVYMPKNYNLSCIPVAILLYWSTYIYLYVLIYIIAKTMVHAPKKNQIWNIKLSDTMLLHASFSLS